METKAGKRMEAGGQQAMLAASLLVLAQVCMAQDVAPDWWVRAGGAWVDFDEHIDLTAQGQAIPGGNAHVKNNASFLVETGYRLTPALSLGLTVGVPPRTRLHGRGTVSNVGLIGTVRYAPATLTLQYQWNADTPNGFVPYVGAGMTYVRILDSKDGSVTGFKARSAWGGVLQAGLEYRLSRDIGVFIDVKKLFVSTTATGDLGAAPVHADIRLNPLISTAGVVFRF